MAVMKPTTDSVPSIYKQGERFCQLVIVPIKDIKNNKEKKHSKKKRRKKK